VEQNYSYTTVCRPNRCLSYIIYTWIVCCSGPAGVYAHHHHQLQHWCRFIQSTHLS